MQGNEELGMTGATGGTGAGAGTGETRGAGGAGACLASRARLASHKILKGNAMEEPFDITYGAGEKQL